MTIVSIFFDVERIYVVVLEQEQGMPVNLSAMYVCEHPLLLHTSVDTLYQSPALKQLEEIFGEIQKRFRMVHFSVHIAVAMDFLHAHLIPLPEDGIIPGEEQEFLQFEFSQYFEATSVPQFFAYIFPLYADDSESMALVVFFHHAVRHIGRYLAGLLGAGEPVINVAQMSAFNVIATQYPESHVPTVAMVNLQHEFVDISVIHHQQLFDTITFSNETHSLLSRCREYFAELHDKRLVSIDEVYFFGPALTQSILQEAIQIIPCHVTRLNPFRTLRTSISQREREYCSRVAHHFAPCIGASFPDILSCRVV